jgi:hypothetical protein
LTLMPCGAHRGLHPPTTAAVTVAQNKLNDHARRNRAERRDGRRVRSLTTASGDETDYPAADATPSQRVLCV